VKLIIDLGAKGGIACVYWLATYWAAKVVAFEPDPKHAAQLRVNLGSQPFMHRATVYPVLKCAEGGPNRTVGGGCLQTTNLNRDEYHSAGLDLCALFAGQRIDIMRMDIAAGKRKLIEDPRFAELDIRALVVVWRELDTSSEEYAWISARLTELGFRLYPSVFAQKFRVVWGFRQRALVRANTMKGPSS
jgi:FkbM family methyltransferase